MIIIGGGISVRDDMIDEINQRLDIIIDKVEPARIKPVVINVPLRMMPILLVQSTTI